jgi:signal transduction histidine kinase
VRTEPDAPTAAPAPVPSPLPAPPLPAADDDPDLPDWRRAPVGREGLRSDALLAAGLFCGALLSMVLWRVAGLYEEPAPAWLSVLALAAQTGALAARRRWPSAVLAVVTVAFVVHVEVRVPETLFANIALFCALYTVGAWEPDRRRALWARGVVIVGMFGWLTAKILMTTNDPEALPDLSRAGAFSPLVAYLVIQLLTNVLYFAGAFWFGERQWASARERARTELRTRQLERERRRVAQQAVAIERLRLARELHDAVAHHVSMMGVQAAAARTLLDADPARARASLEQVEESAREAIGELQGILGTLRDESSNGDGEAGAVGSLGVEALPDLVASARDAGLGATFQVVGDPVRLPPLLSLNLYRIAQEALTNTRKHAGQRAHADVRLRYLDDAVELEVADDGASRSVATPPARTPGTGLGLIGIRERVAADGGTLEARPRSRGGFLVRARIPLEKGSRA